MNENSADAAENVACAARPLTLLFYLPSLGGGGAERLLAVLASELARRGHRVILAVDYEDGANEAWLDAAVERVVLGRNHAASALALRRVLLRLKPDASLSALGGQNIKHLFAALASGRLARAVQSYHGFFESEPKLLSRISYLATPFSSRLMAKTVCVSDSLRAELISRFHAASRRTIRLYNGTPQAAAGARQVKEGPPVILACGRLSPDKNYPFLIRAFAMAKTRDANLVILGEGAERPVIEAEIARLGLGLRVSLPGFCDPAPWYDAASCFAMTSTHETFGLVVVEALARGLPVVTTPSGGPSEILDGGRYGTIVPLKFGDGRDETAFAAAIDDALANADDPTPLFARAAEFSIAACADGYETLFQQIARDADP